MLFRSNVNFEKEFDSLQTRDQKVYGKYTEKQRERRGLQLDRINTRKIKYVPVPTDMDDAVEKNLAFLEDAEETVEKGQGGLGLLQGGGDLWVVGHGNFGTAIGGHHKNLGARKLAEALETDGLPKAPDAPIWLYLWACWAATHTRRAWGGLGYREPFARRLARAMAKRGFTKYFIVGFAGSVKTDTVYQSYRTEKTVIGVGKTDYKVISDNAANIARAAYVVYQVQDGDFDRIHGEDWSTNAHRVWGDPRKLKNITVDRRSH